MLIKSISVGVAAHRPEFQPNYKLALVGARTIQRSVVCVPMTAKPLHSSKFLSMLLYVIFVSIKTFVNFAKVGFTIFSSDLYSH